MADFYLKTGNTADPIVVVLTDDDGAVDLTGLTVKFRMKKDTGTVTKVDGVAVVDPDQEANTGRVSYQWVEADVDTPGDFIGEFVVFDGDDSEAFPNGNRYLSIVIGKSIPAIPAPAP
jgi:hypothetical protein